MSTVASGLVLHEEQLCNKKYSASFKDTEMHWEIHGGVFFFPREELLEYDFSTRTSKTRERDAAVVRAPRGGVCRPDTLYGQVFEKKGSTTVPCHNSPESGTVVMSSSDGGGGGYRAMNASTTG